jgi:hypothetical protein
VIFALLFVVAVFALAFLLRVGAARRVTLMRKWPSILLGIAALVLLMRGAWQPASAAAACAWLAWLLWPPRERPAQIDLNADADRDARMILGVGPNATDAEIRDAFRERMRAAHPDSGGSHAAAARVTAARDRLLKRRRA